MFVYALLGALGLLLLALAAFWFLRRFQISLHVPVKGDVDIRTPIELNMDVPFEMVLTEKELDLTQLEIPLQTGVFIDEQVQLHATLPVLTEIATPFGKVPIKANVRIDTQIPIRQTIQLRDTLKLDVRELRIPIRAVVPIRLSVPIERNVTVNAGVEIPLDASSLRLSVKRRPD